MVKVFLKDLYNISNLRLDEDSLSTEKLEFLFYAIHLNPYFCIMNIMTVKIEFLKKYGCVMVKIYLQKRTLSCVACENLHNPTFLLTLLKIFESVDSLKCFLLNKTCLAKPFHFIC